MWRRFFFFGATANEAGEVRPMLRQDLIKKPVDPLRRVLNEKQIGEAGLF